MRARPWIVVFIVLLAVVIVRGFLLIPSPTAPATSTAATPAHKPAPIPQHAHSSSQATALATHLNAPDSTAEEDVRTLLDLLHQYLRQTRGRTPPIGDDIDLVHALTGHNPLKRSVLPADHPAITADGHLRDRWGTPYFIHPRASDAYEIRSAGPDRQLFTADDIIANPGS